MARKKNIVRKVFTLKERHYITPHFIRITLESDSVAEYANTTIGANNKIFLAPEGCAKVYLPELDEEKKQWKPMDPEIKPYVRTYTHRGIDLEKKEIYIDFVAHGDEGPASKWAIHAPIGAELGVAMGTDASSLYPKAEKYFLIGDATAIPVLTAILESLPADVEAYLLLEVQSKEDIQELQSDSQFSVEWLVNPTPGQNSPLVERAKTLIALHEVESKFAYIAAEFTVVKLLRNYLRKEEGWTKEELYAYSYWKFGKAENDSESERRKELREEA